jgi:hypothetical protein
MNRTILAATVLCLAAGLAACSSPSGPIEPTVAASPETPVVIDPEIARYVVVPAAPEPNQGYRTSPDGLLQYHFQLQNTSAERLGLRIKATFFDESGFPVDTQDGTRHFLAAYEIKTIPVICSNTRGKKVQVQVQRTTN